MSYRYLDDMNVFGKLCVDDDAVLVWLLPLYLL